MILMKLFLKNVALYKNFMPAFQFEIFVNKRLEI